MAQRALQQEQVQKGLESLSGAIQNLQRDRVANALTQQYAAQGMIPQEMGGQGGQAGLAAANQYMASQRNKLYDVPLGGQVGTVQMTPDEIARIYGTTVRYGGRTGGFGGDMDNPTWQDNQGRTWMVGPSGRPVLAPRYLQGQQFQPPPTLRGVPGITTYFGTRANVDPTKAPIKRGWNDFDWSGGWQDPDNPDITHVPVYTDPDKHGSGYSMKPNPNYDPNDPNTGPENIPDTLDIPTDTFHRSFPATPQYPPQYPTAPRGNVPQTPSTPPVPAPQPGDTDPTGQYRFKGGNPKDPNNWEEV